MNIYQDRILYLVNFLNTANSEYYKGEPLIEDEEYDSLYSELLELERSYPDYICDNSPTKKVGYKCEESDRFSLHKNKMYSLNKVHSIEELNKWISSLSSKFTNKKISYLFQPKIDGAAISIDYINGHLKEVRTRGDGYKGVIITDIISKYTSIPKYLYNYPSHLPSHIEIRGEIYIPLDIFSHINSLRESQGLSLFSNPRNLASSVLNSKDENKIKDKGLHFFPYDVLYEAITLSQSDKVELLTCLGFNICSNTYLCNDIESLIDHINNWETQRNVINYLTDGAVIKINDNDMVNALGFTHKYPKWAIAYKYIEEYKYTKLHDVIFQVGPSGVITPVALFDPISLNNTLVSRATLHNESFINTLDLYIGDSIKVKKAGDVIPKVIANSRTDFSLNKVSWPKLCPSCNSVLIRESDKRTYCVNTSCPCILKQNIIKLCSSDCLDIKGIGPSLIDKLVDHNLIKNPLDIFFLEKIILIQLDNIKEKSASNIISSINRAKDKELYRFIYSLNIPSVGLRNSINLCKVINTLESFLSLNYDKLIYIEGIGDINANKILQWLNIKQNRSTLKKVFDICSNFNTPETLSNNRIKIYITGKINDYSKKKIKNLLPDHFLLLDKFNYEINALIIGDRPSMKKVNLCINRGIKTLTWESFLKENAIILQ